MVARCGRRAARLSCRAPVWKLDRLLRSRPAFDIGIPAGSAGRREDRSGEDRSRAAPRARDTVITMADRNRSHSKRRSPARASVGSKNARRPPRPESPGITSSALERFLRYSVINTRSDEGSSSCPSTPGQLTLLRILVNELTAVGLTDVSMDEHGYVMGTIPATPTKLHGPGIGFIAHVDTCPEMQGHEVRPIVHPNYDGRDLVLPDDPTAVLRVSEDPALAAHVGHDLVTASGHTLLGADDKAGVAEIVAAAEYLIAHPEIPHGTVRVAFTPDEEIGRGANRFDVGRFGALCAYTMDGGSAGELEWESFSADAMMVTFKGFNTHPGYAKGRMISAVKLAAEFIDK